MLSGRRLDIDAAMPSSKGQRLLYNCLDQFLSLAVIACPRRSTSRNRRVNPRPRPDGWGQGRRVRREQLRNRASRTAAPARGAEGLGLHSGMAASVFSSRLLAAAALWSHPPRTALRAAVQVLRPSSLLLRGSVGERETRETWLLSESGEGIRGPVRGHFSVGDIG